MSSFQTNYYRPGPAPPRYVSLNAKVVGMDGARVDALTRKVEKFADEVCAEYGIPRPEVKVT